MRPRDEVLASHTIGWWRRHDAAETMAILEHLWSARLERMDAHLDRIDRTGRWLGRRLALHAITRDQADARLRSLCEAEDRDAVRLPGDDPERPPRVALVPGGIAEERAVAALRRGLHDRRRSA